MAAITVVIIIIIYLLGNKHYNPIVLAPVHKDFIKFFFFNLTLNLLLPHGNPSFIPRLPSPAPAL